MSSITTNAEGGVTINYSRIEAIGIAGMMFATADAMEAGHVKGAPGKNNAKAAAKQLRVHATKIANRATSDPFGEVLGYAAANHKEFAFNA